jgi:hypothetical protein
MHVNASKLEAPAMCRVPECHRGCAQRNLRSRLAASPLEDAQRLVSAVPDFIFSVSAGVLSRHRRLEREANRPPLCS